MSMNFVIKQLVYDNNRILGLDTEGNVWWLNEEWAQNGDSLIKREWVLFLENSAPRQEPTVSVES